MKPDSTDFLQAIAELRERHVVEVTEDDYRQSAASDSCVAYLEARPQGL